MSLVIKKENGKLYYHYVGDKQRDSSTLNCIIKANEIYQWNDFPYFLIDTSDKGNINCLSYTNDLDNYSIMIPDFWFDCWKETGILNYNDSILEIDKHGLNPYKINKVGWIGAISCKDRRILIEIGNEHPDIFDFIEMAWIHDNNNNATSSRKPATQYIPLPSLVETYSILIDVRGTGYSGRLKSLLWSHRPVLLVDRKYKEYFYEYLKPWIHYIPVNEDLSDLIEKTHWCLKNYDEALQIAENAYQFAKIYLTREGCYEQWNKVITNLRHNIIIQTEIIWQEC
jgi:hypothetical protein